MPLSFINQLLNWDWNKGKSRWVECEMWKVWIVIKLFHCFLHWRYLSNAKHILFRRHKTLQLNAVKLENEFWYKLHEAPAQRRMKSRMKNAKCTKWDSVGLSISSDFTVSFPHFLWPLTTGPESRDAAVQCYCPVPSLTALWDWTWSSRLTVDRIMKSDDEILNNSLSRLIVITHACWSERFWLQDEIREDW